MKKKNIAKLIYHIYHVYWPIEGGEMTTRWQRLRNKTIIFAAENL